jgi:enoyl-CoA hydratase/carnithine racemase
VTSTVDVEERPDRLVVTLNRPSAGNAITAAMDAFLAGERG